MWAMPGSASGISPGPYALNGRQIVHGSPCSSSAARTYTSPVSFEKPYADRGTGHSQMWSSVVGYSVACSKTIEDET
jgi:hypothetical protein